MTPSEARDELNRLAVMSLGDPESAHSMADDVICQLLTELGFPEVVAAFQQVERWYA